MIIEVEGVRISLEFLPYLVSELDGARIITKDGRVVDAKRDGDSMRFTVRRARKAKAA